MFDISGTKRQLSVPTASNSATEIQHRESSFGNNDLWGKTRAISVVAELLVTKICRARGWNVCIADWRHEKAYFVFQSLVFVHWLTEFDEICNMDAGKPRE